eukprot:GEZU01023801.1.p2 GENE.GEZU01023801.1~~GEZU01023801.1.p2  ORF type:complete len:234 (-),score=59.14 GEZU01023801.1:1008-1709(-)
MHPSIIISVLGGYPPKEIVGDDSATLASLSIRNGDQLILKEKGSGPATGIVRGVSTDGVYVPPSNTKGYFVRRVVPSDNSCLFHACAYVLENKSRSKGPQLRKLVAETVAANPDRFTSSFLGMPNPVYCSWIQDPDTWGGAIELSILSFLYSVEIVAFDTQTQREDKYGEDMGYSRRALIMYTGSHYDALALAPYGGAVESSDQVIFNSKDESVMKKARAMIEEEFRNQWKKK